jgi:2-C-methyl-D-erythritol 2,4-cyclodiphosphate synthase
VFKIGQGYDVHAFGKGEKIVIGGVVIPYERGLVAHSDGDVLLHALCDALLGALALGDIGRHFPDTDAQYKGIDSRTLLRLVYAHVKKSGYRLGNADMTIIAQAPKMAPHIGAMVEKIAADLEVGIDCVNVKATTTETLGFTGRKEGIAAEAVVLLHKSDLLQKVEV